MVERGKGSTRTAAIQPIAEPALDSAQALALRERSIWLTKGLRDTIERTDGTVLRVIWAIIVATFSGVIAVLEWPREPSLMLLFGGISLVAVTTAGMFAWAARQFTAITSNFGAGLKLAGLTVEGEQSAKTVRVSDPISAALADVVHARDDKRARQGAGPERLALYTFAWTPPGSRLGSIALREIPTGHFTAGAYRRALAERIDRLFADADDEDRAEAIRQIERQEHYLSLGAAPGEALVRWSEWSRARVYVPIDGFTPAEMKHEPDTLETLLANEPGIAEFVAELYHDPDY